jgi:hypothetical protein
MDATMLGFLSVIIAVFASNLQLNLRLNQLGQRLAKLEVRVGHIERHVHQIEQRLGAS